MTYSLCIKESNAKMKPFIIIYLFKTRICSQATVERLCFLSFMEDISLQTTLVMIDMIENGNDLSQNGIMSIYGVDYIQYLP